MVSNVPISLYPPIIAQKMRNMITVSAIPLPKTIRNSNRPLVSVAMHRLIRMSITTIMGKEKRAL
jgi:hypothetical protein